MTIFYILLALLCGAALGAWLPPLLRRCVMSPAGRVPFRTAVDVPVYIMVAVKFHVPAGPLFLPVRHD